MRFQRETYSRTNRKTNNIQRSKVLMKKNENQIKRQNESNATSRIMQEYNFEIGKAEEGGGGV